MSIWGRNFGANTSQMTVHKIPVHVCNPRTRETLLNPHFMNINGNLWIFMNFERALRVCLFLNTFLERSFEFVKCLVCQLCFCTLDFVWIPFSGVKFKIFSKSFQFFLPILINLVKNLTQNHLKKVYFASFWSKSVWFLDQNSWQFLFYLSIELVLILPYLWNKLESQDLKDGLTILTLDLQGS